MLNKVEIRTHLREILADETSVMLDAELNKIIDLAIIDYSMIRPLIVDTEVTSVEGTLNYPLPAGTVSVYDVLNVASTSVAVIQSGQTLRFDTNPGSAVYTVRAAVLHTIDVDGNYPTIPEYELSSILNLAQAIMFERIADDILRRPDIGVGQTRETWGDAAKTFYQRAKELRSRVSGGIGDEYFFVG